MLVSGITSAEGQQHEPDGVKNCKKIKLPSEDIFFAFHLHFSPHPPPCSLLRDDS